MEQPVSAFTDDALGEHDTVGLVGAIQSRAVSVVEVVEAAIARTERVSGPLGAMACPDYDTARRVARDPHGGYFAGVPMVLKDNVAARGLAAAHGTDAWTAVPAPEDGDLARMVRATGLLPLGSAQLSELGYNASAEHARLPPVRNPWSPSHTAGASSAGAAALVASGALPLAHANDGGGSIRIPASATGLVGLKPSRGRLAQDVTMRRLPVRIISDGVLTRSVRDTAAFFRESEKVYRALHLPPVGDLTRPGRARLRVALSTAAPGRSADAETAAAVRRTGALLADLGHTVVEVDPPVPESFAGDFLLYWASLAALSVGAGRVLYGPRFDRSLLDPLTRGLARHARRHARHLPGAIRRLRGTAALSAAFFADHDVTLSPTVRHATPLLGHLDPAQGYDVVLERLLGWVAFTPWQNATGDPAISLPLASDAAGLPLGILLGAPCGHEARLVELAYELEEARPFARLGASRDVSRVGRPAASAPSARPGPARR